MKFLTNYASAIIAILSVFASCANSFAEVIFIENAGFEDQFLLDGASSTTVSGWSTLGAATVLNPASQQFPGGNASEGFNVVNLPSALPGTIIQQSLARNFEYGQYIFEFDVGDRLDQPFPDFPAQSFSLLGGGIIALADSITPAVSNGTYTTWRYEYDVTPTNANGTVLLGRELRLRFLSLDSAVNGSVVIDNVRGSFVAAVPEPSSLALLAVTTIFLFACQRTRNAKRTTSVEITKMKRT